jgi:hypothetical protein
MIPELNYSTHLTSGTTLSGRVFFFLRNKEGVLRFGII